MKRPYVRICSGMSLDGKISNFQKNQSEIATDDDREMLWEARAWSDAIMIGGNQLRLDDPKLDVRGEVRLQARRDAGKEDHPLKVAVVTDLSTIASKDGDFFTKGGNKIFYTTANTPHNILEEYRSMQGVDAYIFGGSQVNLQAALTHLSSLGVEKLMVEGGGELNYSLLSQRLVDEVHLKIGNLVLGGRDTITFMEGTGLQKGIEMTFDSVDARANYIIVKCKPKYS